jgi:hypothetical protein
MFGVEAPRDMDRAHIGPTAVYTSSLTGALIFGLGLVCLTIALGLAAELAGSWLSILIVGLPLLAGAALGLALGYANLHSLIEIGPGGLKVVAPSWRGVPMPPLQHASVPWSGVRALRHRTEIYGIGALGLQLAVEVYALATDQGRVVLAGYYLNELEPIMIQIGDRAGREISEEGEVEVGLLPMLCGTPPPWSD